MRLLATVEYQRHTPQTFPTPPNVLSTAAHRRMGYLKDVVLPRVLDDATFATLSSLMLFNNIEVLMALHHDRDFFPELFRWGPASWGRHLYQYQVQGALSLTPLP